MPLEFQVQNQNGESDTIDMETITQQLQQSGEQIAGISADGGKIRLVDDKGEFDVTPEKALSMLGWQVQSSKPLNPNYDHVNTQWRAALEMLPADDHKRAYIEGQMKRAGFDKPQIVGSGSDWYAFDPEQNNYIALTNKPGADMSDLGEAGAKFPRFLGSVVGGGAGAIAGGGVTPAAVALGAGGSALGGLAGDTMAKGAMAAYDPVFKDIATERFGDMAKSAGMHALEDAAFGAVPPGLGMVAKPLGQAFNRGIVSSGVRGAGRLAEAGGEMLATGAKALDRPLGHLAAGSQIPIANAAMTTGFMGQLPGQAIRGAARGLGAAGESDFMRSVAPEAASWLSNTSRGLLKPVAGKSTAVPEAARIMSGTPKVARTAGDATTEDVLGNLGEMIGGGRQHQESVSELSSMLRNSGYSSEESYAIAKKMVEEPARAATGRRIGSKIGKGIQNVEDVSRGIENLGTAIGTGAVKTAKHVGTGASKIGTAARVAGTLAQPLENRALMRYGAEEMFDPYIQDLTPWQERRKRDKMIFANN